MFDSLATRIAGCLRTGFYPSCSCCISRSWASTKTASGLLLTLTLIGDTIISLAITTTADRIGRKGMLIFGAVLVVFAGALFASNK